MFRPSIGDFKFLSTTSTDGRYGKSDWVQLPSGIKMHFVEAGKGDGDKPLMVFLHGFPEFWFSWRYQLKHFSRDFW